jgi:hypothetical protein
MKPIEKTAEARGPAIGASAAAASAAVVMVTGPFRPIVDDVETMMANIASVLTSMPTNTSIRERNSLVPALPVAACGQTESPLDLWTRRRDSAARQPAPSH